jgi:hypothetical protein
MKHKRKKEQREGKKKYRSVIIGTQFRTCVPVLRDFIGFYISFLANINTEFL